MKAKEIGQEIFKKTGVFIPAEHTCDGFKSGDPEAEVTGIVTTFMATMEVLRKTVKSGANMIITHEPTWFTGHDTTSWLEGDPVYLAKKKFIEENNLIIWRFHDSMHMSHDGDRIMDGFGAKLGWNECRVPYEKEGQEFGAMYLLPEGTTLGNVARTLHEKLGMTNIQMVGSPDMPVRKVASYPGGGSLGLGTEEMPMIHMRENQVDLALCGDITGWTLVPYIKDCQAVGINKSIIIMGHERSEEMGMELMLDWLKEITGDIPVQFIDSEEPFSYINY